MTAFDATDDYVTCPRCGRMRGADVPSCSRCETLDRLTDERFAALPRSAARTETDADRQYRLRELAAAVRRRRHGRRSGGRL